MEHKENDVLQERELAQRVLSHPKFKAMEKQKSILGWSFSAVMFFVYVAFIWTIGTSPQTLGAKVSEGSIITLGIYMGVAMIIFAFLITLVYVWLANGKYEDMTQEVVKEVMGENK